MHRNNTIVRPEVLPVLAALVFDGVGQGADKAGEVSLTQGRPHLGVSELGRGVDVEPQRPREQHRVLHTQSHEY